MKMGERSDWRKPRESPRGSSSRGRGGGLARHANSAQGPPRNFQEPIRGGRGGVGPPRGNWQKSSSARNAPNGPDRDSREAAEQSPIDWSRQIASGIVEGMKFTDCPVKQVVPHYGTIICIRSEEDPNGEVLGLIQTVECSPERKLVEFVTVEKVLPSGMVTVKWELKRVPDPTAPLIILDLNGVLLARPSFKERKQNRVYTKRRHCDEFIRFCFEHFNVGVWSCGKRKTMEMELFEPYKDRLVFQWDQENSTNLWPRTSIVSAEKPLFLKELSKIFETFPGRFDSSNTLLLDNHAEKFERNPLETCILVPEFTNPRHNDDFLSSNSNLTRGLLAFSSHHADHTSEDRAKALRQIQSSFYRERLAALFTSSDVMKRNCPERDTAFYMHHRDIPGPRAKPFRRNLLSEILQYHTSWVVCEKSNGVRNMLLAFPNRGPCFVVNRSWEFTFVGESPFPGDGWTLLDGELITGSSKTVYLVFDAIFLNGKDVGAIPNLIDRLDTWKRFVGDVSEESRKEPQLSQTEVVSLGSIHLVTKVFKPISSIENLRDAVRTYTYDVAGLVTCDGLVFTPKYLSYYEYTVVKFKPVDELTVDFRMLKNDVRQTSSTIDTVPLYLVEYQRQPNGGSQLIDVQCGRAAISENVLPSILKSKKNSVIVECCFDPAEGLWTVANVREDKVKPNALSTGWSVLESIAENVRVDSLISEILEVIACNPDPPSQECVGGSNLDTAVSSVAKHYNERQAERNQTRNNLDSRINGLRKLNNWSKAVLIHECCMGKLEFKGRQRPPEELPAIPLELLGNAGPPNWRAAKNQPKRQEPVKILDLACGRGGDLQKWMTSSIVDTYVGIDIAGVALEEARARIGQKKQFQFVEFDMSDLALLDHPAITNTKFDIVSIQFSFHYICGSPEACSRLFKICSQVLKEKSEAETYEPIIIISTTDQEVLHRRNPDFVNSVCEVHFKQPLPQDCSKIDFGHSYSFTLGDAVRDCEEYVVPLDRVCEIASSYGFSLAFSQNLSCFVVDKVGSYKPMLHSMSVVGSKAQSVITQEEWEAIQFYQVLAFKR